MMRAMNSKAIKPGHDWFVGTVAVAVALLLGIGSVRGAQAAEGATPSPLYAGAQTAQQQNDYLLRGDGALHVLPVRQGNSNEPSVYMVVGAGANITVQVGINGVVLVNAGNQGMSDKVLDALKSVTHAPLRRIIATNAGPDVTGGVKAISATGQWITGGDVSNLIGTSSGVTSVLAAQEVLERMSASGSRDAAPEGNWPNETYTNDNKDIWYNGESIRIYHVRAAHTDGDSMVYFRHSDVVSVGDVYSTARFPLIDLERGGSVQGAIDALNRLVYEVLIPGPQNDGGTLVIPNYGRLSGYSDVVFYQQMLIMVRDRVQALIGQKKSLQQVLAAQPALEFEPRYGANTGGWTTTDFVTAVYKSLAKAGQGGSGRTGSAK
jgi:glyoxylase-like metal-dependent hydrolase (beta-lactamase superfamily II)